MKPDDPPEREPPPNPETPPASLTELRVSRLTKRMQPDAKPGDLTPQATDARDKPPASPPDRATPKRGDLTQHLAQAASVAARVGERKPSVPPAAKTPAAGAALMPPTPTVMAKPSPALQASTPPAPAAPPAITKAVQEPAAPPTPPNRALEQDEVDRMFEAAEPTPANNPLRQDEIDRMFEAGEPERENQTLDQDEVDRLLNVDPPAAPAPQPALMVDPQEREVIPPAPALRLVADAPATTPAPPRSTAGPAPTTTAGSASAGSKSPAGSVDEIIDYWDGLRGDKPFPRLDQIDRAQIGRTWPNCLLVGFGPVDTTTPQITRLGKENGEVEYGEMVIHWILSRGRVAARRSEPLEEEKRFPVTGGQARYQLLLLPLGTREGKSEHVLCHLSRLPEVNRGNAFKRWFAS